MVDGTDFVERAKLASSFLANHLKFRERIREQSSACAGDLLDAHCFALSANVSYQSRVQGIEYEAGDPTIDGQMNLVAQFMQGIDLTEVAISEGLYAHAGALLKQALETVIAIDEYTKGTRIDGKTPQFGGTNFGRLYGELNKMAHPSKADYVNTINTYSIADKAGPTTIPQFNDELYRTLYGQHAMLLVMMFARLRTVFLPIFNIDWDVEELALIQSSHRILLSEGILNPTS